MKLRVSDFETVLVLAKRLGYEMKILEENIRYEFFCSKPRQYWKGGALLRSGSGFVGQLDIPLNAPDVEGPSALEEEFINTGAVVTGSVKNLFYPEDPWEFVGSARWFCDIKDCFTRESHSLMACNCEPESKRVLERFALIPLGDQRWLVDFYHRYRLPKSDYLKGTNKLEYQKLKDFGTFKKLVTELGYKMLSSRSRNGVVTFSLTHDNGKTGTMTASGLGFVGSVTIPMDREKDFVALGGFLQCPNTEKDPGSWHITREVEWACPEENCPSQFSLDPCFCELPPEQLQSSLNEKLTALSEEDKKTLLAFHYFLKQKLSEL